MSARKRRSGIEDCYKVIGERIKQARLSVNVSQTDLAAALHLSRATITQYESGETRPSLHVIAEIAEALGITMDDVILATNTDAAEGWRRRAIAAETTLARIHAMTAKGASE